MDTPHGSSTVYVHGFGTDDGYDRYNHPQAAYGYGHLNHKQGYGYGKVGYAGYNSVYAPHHAVHGVGHHGLGVAHHPLHLVAAGQAAVGVAALARVHQRLDAPLD